MPTPLNYIIDWIFGQALQAYSGVRVSTNVHVSHFAYADDIVLLGKSYTVSRCLLKAVNYHAAAVGMCVNVSKNKMISALIRVAQCQAGLLDDGPQKDVDFKYFGSMFITKGQDAEKNQD